jgi:hypothetical protein
LTETSEILRVVLQKVQKTAQKFINFTHYIGAPGGMGNGALNKLLMEPLSNQLLISSAAS